MRARTRGLACDLSTGGTLGGFLQSSPAVPWWEGLALSSSSLIRGSLLHLLVLLFPWEAVSGHESITLAERKGRMLLLSLPPPNLDEGPGDRDCRFCWVSCFWLLLDLHKAAVF